MVDTFLVQNGDRHSGQPLRCCKNTNGEKERSRERSRERERERERDREREREIDEKGGMSEFGK